MQQIGLQARRPEHLGQASVRLASEKVELKQTVLGGRIAEAEEEIGIRLGLAARNTPPIAAGPDRVRQSIDA